MMTTTWLARRAGAGGLLLAVLMLPLAAGCQARTGTVSGRVIYANKPLPGGLVTFVPTEQGRNVMSSPIDEHGNYEVTLTVGAYDIMVDNSELEPHTQTGALPALPPGIKLPADIKLPQTKKEPAAPNGGGTKSGRYVAIPEKYYNTSTSGLSYAVTAGSQAHDIELK